jgi:hypothetical protein
MSYILHFYSENKSPGHDEVLALLSALPLMDISSDGKQLTADYSNLDTGVFCRFLFRFAKDESDDSEQNPEFGGYIGLQFKVDLMRPSTFGWEALPLAIEVAQKLDCLIQLPGEPVQAPMVPKWLALFNDWDKQNRELIRQVLDRKQEEIFAVDSDTLHDWWEWMKNLPSLQQKVGEQYMVGRVAFLKEEATGRLHRVAVWPNLMPILVTELDYIIISIERPGPDGPVQEEKMVPFERLAGDWFDTIKESEESEGAKLITAESINGQQFIGWFEQLEYKLEPEKYRLWPVDKVFDNL